MTPVIGRVDDPSCARGGLDDIDVLAQPFDFAEDWIERMLERAIDRVPLCRPELFEIGVNALARGAPAVPVQIARDVVPR